MLIVADINTIWRAQPFIAFSQYRRVLGIAPRSVLQIPKQWRWSWLAAPNEERFTTMPILLLPGWASKTAWFEQPRVWRAVMKMADDQGWTPSTVVATIPHYFHLLERVPPGVQTVYYASDDYRRYAGWRHSEMEKLEHALLARVDWAVFVSRALANRARREQPQYAEKIRVSMNATEDRFFPTDSPDWSGETAGPSMLRALRRPIVGVVGAINRRLDFDVLQACASLDAVGTLLFVGSIKNAKGPQFRVLRENPKCKFIGEQPHHSIPAWMQSLDVAIIPYREDPFNYYCSPMRLFDHLASGRPIVASDACDQIRDFSAFVDVAGQEEFPRRLEEAIRKLPEDDGRPGRIELAREHTWAKRAAALDALLGNR